MYQRRTILTMFSMNLAVRLLLLAGVAVVGLLAACSYPPLLESCDDVAGATTRGGNELPASSGGVLVSRVIDGDTIELDDGSRIRYIGVDTPERGEKFYQEATDLNRQLVEGERVHLLRDTTNQDQFGGLLRYVLAGDILVNAELVREGLAEAKAYPPDDKFAGCFDALMQEAKDEKRGLWAQ